MLPAGKGYVCCEWQYAQDEINQEQFVDCSAVKSCRLQSLPFHHEALEQLHAIGQAGVPA